MKKTVVQILRTPAGGIRKHVYDILEGLKQDEFNHILITNLKDADRPVPPLKDLIIYNLDISEHPSLKDFLNLVKICHLLYQKKVDVIHGHGAKGGLYARIVSYLLRCRCIYTPHGGSLHRVHGKVKNIIYDFIEILMIPFTDVFLFESRYSRKLFLENVLDIGGKAIVNYNGIALPSRTATSCYSSGKILRLASFGLLRHLKGHDIVVEACAFLDKKGIPFNYCIYGKGEEHERLRAKIKVLGLEGKVFLREYTDDVYKEMLKYDFIIHPSRFESFGYVPVEAMALNIPIVSSQNGGLKEVVDSNCGFVARENTPEEYAGILESIFLGKTSVCDKTEAAYTKVLENFSLQKMLKTIELVYLS